MNHSNSSSNPTSSRATLKLKVGESRKEKARHHLVRTKSRQLLTPLCITMTTRKLLPGEAAKLRDHLARLTREERSLRFMGAQNDAAVAEHCERLDWFRTVVVGFFDAGVLRGVAELQIADNHLPILCEVAISVETGWQDQGVATELVRRVLVIARNRSARGVQINCFSDNYRIQHIARKFGARFRCQAGESEAEIPTRAPTYSSLCEEMIDDGFGWMGIWFDKLHVYHLQIARWTGHPLC